MELIVFQAPGMILARVSTANPEETPIQYLLVGWDQDGQPIIARVDGHLSALSADETITDLVFLAN